MHFPDYAVVKLKRAKTTCCSPSLLVSIYEMFQDLDVVRLAMITASGSFAANILRRRSSCSENCNDDQNAPNTSGSVKVVDFVNNDSIYIARGPGPHNQQHLQHWPYTRTELPRLEAWLICTLGHPVTITTTLPKGLIY